MRHFSRLQLIVLAILSLCIWVLPARADELRQLSLLGQPQLLSDVCREKDASGQYCAIIQVISDIDGFSYDANLRVVKIEDNPGEDNVFLSPGERVLRIMHTGYEPLRLILSEHGIQLKEKQVWRIKIKAEQQNPEVNVTFSIQPQTAELTVDEIVLGQQRTIKLTTGLHLVRLTANDYEVLEETIQVDAENLNFPFMMTPQQDIYLELTSEPTGAEVIIDGRRIGNTPYAEPFPSGQHQLKLSFKNGLYLSRTETITLSGKQQKATYHYILAPNFGEIALNTPANARVSVDQEIKGRGPQKLVLKAGAHLFRVELDDHYPQEKRIVVVAGEKDDLALMPRPHTGKVAVLVEPKSGAAAKVYLDNQYRGEAPQILESVRVGRHQLRVTKKNYVGREQTFDLRKDQKKEIHLTLDTYAHSKQAEKDRWRRRRNWSLLFTVGAGAGAGYTHFIAEQAYQDYQAATSMSETERLRDKTETYDLYRNIALGTTGACFIWTIINHKKMLSVKIPAGTISLNVQPGPDYMMAQLVFER